MRCISREQTRWLILALSAVGFVVLMALLIHETLSVGSIDDTNLIILAIPACVLFMIMIAMVADLRHGDLHEYREPEYYLDNDRL